MTSVVKEINETLLNIVNDLKNRLEESRELLADIQAKMDSKLDEAKQYKVQVDDAKTNIKRLEEEIAVLQADLSELKEKYGKKNLVAVIEAGTKEINIQIKQKQDEIAVHKNKIAELTNRARSIKDLLVNLKKDKKIKEERLNDIDASVKYYDARLNEIITYTEEHQDLNDYFVLEKEEPESNDSSNVFEDIASIDNNLEDNVSKEVDFEPVTLEESDEVFSQVIDNTLDEDEVDEKFDDESNENIVPVLDDEPIVEEPAMEVEDSLKLESIEEEKEISLEDTHDLEINDLLSSVKEPIQEPVKTNTIESLNKAIDDEFSNIFGKSINEPISFNSETDFFGKEYNLTTSSEGDVINSLTNLGLDYYSFLENDRKYIIEHYNEQTISGIIRVLKDNNISLDNIYQSVNLLGEITPAELSNIVSKLLSVGQSSEAIGYVLDKLPLVDINLLNITINNYGDYVKNVDIADLIIKSLKGGN